MVKTPRNKALKIALKKTKLDLAHLKKLLPLHPDLVLEYDMFLIQNGKIFRSFFEDFEESKN